MQSLKSTSTSNKLRSNKNLIVYNAYKLYIKHMCCTEGPNVSTTPITAMGCRQCLLLNVVQLKGKHCRKPHCRNGVVDTFELYQAGLFLHFFTLQSAITAQWLKCPVSMLSFFPRFQNNPKTLSNFTIHTTYRKNNNNEKCVGIGLNGLIFKKNIVLMRKNDPGSSLGFAY
jgi:hypothetical protein